jgi:glycosyltransferase involved in cell wall biosynthesis
MEKKKIILSVALAVRNEESNLELCLSSIKDIADEIVVVDGDSNDKTVEIAESFHSIVIKTDNPPIFHINKQKALDACRGVWILQLDADEVVTEELKKEIVCIIGHETMSNGQESSNADCHLSHEYNGYYIPRRNYFWGHFMKKGGQYPDYVIRLVKRGYARFPCKSVHEQIQIDGEVGYIKEPMLHYSYRTFDDYWKKAATYTELTAKEFKENGLKKNLGTWVHYVILEPMKTFFLLFIRHKGFLDGIYGFIFAYFSALHYPIAYRKYMKSI